MLLSACTGSRLQPTAEHLTVESTEAVNPAYFIQESLVQEITLEERTLSDGSKAMCYVIVTRSEPHEHEMGPWCPTLISDGVEDGGIWFHQGKVYDVDGAFIANLEDFYEDERWSLVRKDGTIQVTESKEAFLAAARPRVDPRYENHCVEGRPEWFEGFETTYVIPARPVYNERATRLGRHAVGLAFNGVNYDPPAPTHAILAAHTLAPLDDAGGHLNPYAGYHYHAATGQTKEIAQPDGHAPMIGYALDGFGIYAARDENGELATNLDECGGHFDVKRGYHYHVGEAGENQIIKAFRGTPGSASSKH